MNEHIRETAACPYSMHSARITGLRPEYDMLTIEFAEGCSCTESPFYGDAVEITGVKWKYSHVWLMQYDGEFCGAPGPFTGSKVMLTRFMAEHKEPCIDIMGEYYGDNALVLDGFFHDGEEVYEIRMDLNYTGEVKFITK